jgi:hypothetical protein
MAYRHLQMTILLDDLHELRLTTTPRMSDDGTMMACPSPFPIHSDLRLDAQMNVMLVALPLLELLFLMQLLSHCSDRIT